MSLSLLETQESKGITQEMVKILAENLVEKGVIKRWVTRTHYAMYYDYCKLKISNLTNFLREKGAVCGEGKAIRYDKFFNPNIGKRIITN